MAANPNISMLLDVYGALLTPKEYDALDLYYNEDMSLREIADNVTAERIADGASDERAAITRQGVRDAIKRAENKLLGFEERLGLCERLQHAELAAAEISSLAEAVAETNLRFGQVSRISELADEIRREAATITR